MWFFPRVNLKKENSALQSWKYILGFDSEKDCEEKKNILETALRAVRYFTLFV